MNESSQQSPSPVLQECHFQPYYHTDDMTSTRIFGIDASNMNAYGRSDGSQDNTREAELSESPGPTLISTPSVSQIASLSSSLDHHAWHALQPGISPYPGYVQFDAISSYVSRGPPDNSLDSSVNDYENSSATLNQQQEQLFRVPPQHMLMQPTSRDDHVDLLASPAGGHTQQVETPHSDSAETVVASNGAAVSLQFSNRTQAQTHQLARNLGWYPPKDDATIPQNDIQRSAYVLRLKAAMLDISQTTEDSLPFHARWKKPISTGTPPYPLSALEAVCWNVINIAERLHNEGPEFLLIFDHKALAKAAKSKYMTFATRIDAVVELMLVSKKAVDALMRGEKLAVFVACVEDKVKMVFVNRKGNDRRKKSKKGDADGEVDDIVKIGLSAAQPSTTPLSEHTALYDEEAKPEDGPGGRYNTESTPTYPQPWQTENMPTVYHLVPVETVPNPTAVPGTSESCADLSSAFALQSASMSTTQPRKRSVDAAQLDDYVDEPAKRGRRFAESRLLQSPD